MDQGSQWDAEIVSIKGYAKAVVYAPIIEVEAYWESLRGCRVVPLRSEIDARGIANALEHSFLIEKIAPGLARFRLAGQALSDLAGMEVRGMPLTSFFVPAGREAMQEVLTEVFEKPSVATVDLSAETGMGRPPLGGRMVLLPLRSDLGDISRVLGCLVTDAKTGRAPRRFRVQNVRLRELGPFRTPQPNARSESPSGEPKAAGLSEPDEPYRAEPPRPRPVLRLVHSREDDA
ncbi:MAG: PAS domain-containing protein [Pseudomonadota bacterium]